MNLFSIENAANAQNNSTRMPTIPSQFDPLEWITVPDSIVNHPNFDPFSNIMTRPGW